MDICSMFSEDYEEVRMQEEISTAAARGCVERWLLQVCEKTKKKNFEPTITMAYNLSLEGL